MCDNLTALLGNKGQKLLLWIGENVPVYLIIYVYTHLLAGDTGIFIKKKNKIDKSQLSQWHYTEM